MFREVAIGTGMRGKSQIFDLILSRNKQAQALYNDDPSIELNQLQPSGHQHIFYLPAPHKSITSIMMDDRDYSSETENDHRPYKRPRRTPSPSRTNGHPSSLPPLSPSILGVEPFDEFIMEIADFIYHMIKTRPE